MLKSGGVSKTYIRRIKKASPWQTLNLTATTLALPSSAEFRWWRCTRKTLIKLRRPWFQIFRCYFTYYDVTLTLNFFWVIWKLESFGLKRARYISFTINIITLQNCSFLAVDCELSGLGERKRLNVAAVDERWVKWACLNLNHPEYSCRYRNTCLVAKTRSIISLGKYWPLISQNWSRDLDTGLWLVQRSRALILTNPRRVHLHLAAPDWRGPAQLELQSRLLQPPRPLLGGERESWQFTDNKIPPQDYIVEPASLQFLVQHGFDFSAQYGLGLGYNRSGQ